MAKKKAEKILYRGHGAMLRQDPIRWLFYFLLCFVLVGFYFFFRWWWKSFSTRIRLTESRIIKTSGVLNTTETSLNIRDVRALEVDQLWWQKILGIGSVKIASAGSDGWEIEIDGLPSPNRVKHIINAGRGSGSDD